MRFRASIFTFTSILTIYAGLLTANSAAATGPAQPDTPGVESSVVTAPAVPPRPLVLLAGINNQKLYASLESFVCHEEIQRFRETTSSGGAKHVDTVTATVSLENGAEQYSSILRKGRKLRDLARLEGAWSEGEFGTLLKQTGQLLTTQSAILEREENFDGVRTAVYTFTVSPGESPWDLAVEGQHYLLPFRTRIWVSEAAGSIVRIERTSTEIPPALHIAEIDWSVTLRPVDLNSRAWLLPATAEYRVVYCGSGRREWNIVEFSDYHRYGSEVAVRFN